jgi:hypothetical protein
VGKTLDSKSRIKGSWPLECAIYSTSLGRIEFEKLNNITIEEYLKGDMSE